MAALVASAPAAQVAGGVARETHADLDRVGERERQAPALVDAGAVQDAHGAHPRHRRAPRRRVRLRGDLVGRLRGVGEHEHERRARTRHAAAARDTASAVAEGPSAHAHAARVPVWCRLGDGRSSRSSGGVPGREPG